MSKVKYHLLGCFEGQCEIVTPVFRLELTEIKGVWIVVMNQCAKSHAVVPAGAEILDLHVLLVKENIARQRW